MMLNSEGAQRRILKLSHLVNTIKGEIASKNIKLEICVFVVYFNIDAEWWLLEYANMGFRGSKIHPY